MAEYGITDSDPEWKRIQQNTFTRWVNQHLKKSDCQIENIETEFSDGLKLIKLIEVLSKKKIPNFTKKPKIRMQKLENVSISLEFLDKEGVVLVNIDSSHIVDCKLKLILGLVWTLILHYSISTSINGSSADDNKIKKTPKQQLMDWIKDIVSDMNVNNFTSDWKDGKAIGCLVDSKAPGLCPGWKDWDTKNPAENAKHAMDLAETWLDVQKLLTPEEMVNPNIDEQSMMTYLSQFPNSTLKPGAPLTKPNNSLQIKAYGPGIEASGVMVNEKATFSVEDISSFDGKLEVQVIDSTGANLPCSIDKKLSEEDNGGGSTIYNCSYTAKHKDPNMNTEYTSAVFWHGILISKDHDSNSRMDNDSSNLKADIPNIFTGFSKDSSASSDIKDKEQQAIVDNIKEFLDNCWKGLGWSWCRTYCSSNATFRSQALTFHPPQASKPNLGSSLKNYVDWMGIIVEDVLSNCYQTDVELLYDPKTRIALCYCVFHGTYSKTPIRSNLPSPTMKDVATDCSYKIRMDKEGKISDMAKVWNSEWFEKELGWKK